MTKYEQLLWLKEWHNNHRAELQSQPAVVDAIKANAELREVVYNLYFALFNKTLGGCSSCLADAYILLLSKSTEAKMRDIAECKFKLRNGVLLTDITGKLPDATIANLTDEIAVAYLKDNPARIALFEVVPDNWAEMGVNEPKNEAEVQTPTDVEKPAQEAKPARKRTTKK